MRRLRALPSRASSAAAALLALLALAGAGAARAGEIGHYAGGLPNIRDLVVPEPGFYTLIYNYGYRTDRINDRHGDEASSVTINPGPGPGVTLDVDIDVGIYVLAPAFIAVAPWKPAGIKFAAFAIPMFSNASIGASLSTATGSGRDAETGQFALADLYVQPLWIGRTFEHFDLAAAYGFYAPVGKYDTEVLTLPVVGDVRVEAADNIGLGFWTHQLQGAATWYPWADKRMALATAVTYERHGDKQDFDLTPGEDVTFNWGISQYLPLVKDQKLLLELGPAGYSTWQISDDSGSDARSPGAHDQVHAAGGQLGLTYVPWDAVLNFHYFYEFAATDRFQGHVLGLTLGKKWW